MFTQLRLVGVILLLLPISRLFADEPPPQEAPPPTAEEVKEAIAKVGKFFSGTPQPPARPVKQPNWHPLKPEDAMRVEEVLASWDKGRVKTGSMHCQFRQWEFEPLLGPKDPTIPYVYSEGEYRWDDPFIWMWSTTSVRKAVVSGGKTTWLDLHPEKWARNKGTIYELNHRSKTLYERHLDQGSAGIPVFSFFGIIVVPFTTYVDLVRLDPEKLRDRFWIRPVTAADGKKERWLELVPKKDRDAREFSSLLVAVSESDWEVCAIDIRTPNYSARTYPAHTSIEFRNRTRPTAMKDSNCIPSLPKGWRRVVDDLRDSE